MAKKYWYVVPIVLIVIFFGANFTSFVGKELAITKVSTTYGTLDLYENVGITAKSSILQSIKNEEGIAYTEFFLSSTATTTDVADFKSLEKADMPVGSVSGHEILLEFDNDPTTEEALYFDITVDIGGVRWDQLTIYSGTGAQLKVYQPRPQEDSGKFFGFFYQSEIERNWPSFIFQFKGYQHSYERNVFVNTYYSLSYSYIEEATTTTEISGTEVTTTTEAEVGWGINPFASPSVGLLEALIILLPVVLIKRKTKRDEK